MPVFELVKTGRTGTKIHKGLQRSSITFCGLRARVMIKGPVKGKSLCGRCFSAAAQSQESYSVPADVPADVGPGVPADVPADTGPGNESDLPEWSRPM